jgi:hypothetical protein
MAAISLAALSTSSSITSVVRIVIVHHTSDAVKAKVFIENGFCSEPVAE